MTNVIKSCLFLLTIFTRCKGTQEIWDHLFVSQSYNKHIRPSLVWENPTHINFSFSIIAVIEFNEVKETITITGKLTLSWFDDFLRWNASDFSNVSHIHLPQSDVWKPYIVLENSVKGQSELGTPSLQVLVDSSGRVDWKPIQVFHTTCAAKVQKFPFDTQICSMTFEASGYEKNEIEMLPLNDHIEFHEYGGTSGWTISETQIAAVDEGDEFHMICSIKMHRNPVYFLLNIFLPISLLSFLNIGVFILPVESGEKASFVVTVFLSLAVFLTIVSGKLPENSESIAYLNIYVFISTLLSTIIAIVTIILIRIYNRDPERPMSRSLVQFALLCTSTGNREQYTDGTDKPSKNGITKVEPVNHGDNDTQLLEMKMKEKEIVSVSWKRLVKALDNVCFVVFLVINVTMTVTILVIAAKDEKVNFADVEEHDDH